MDQTFIHFSLLAFQIWNYVNQNHYFNAKWLFIFDHDINVDDQCINCCMVLLISSKYVNPGIKSKVNP